MKKLKTILQFKYIISFSILIILFSLIRIGVSKPNYSVNDNTFKLLVLNIVDKKDYRILYLKGKDKLVSYYYKDTNFDIGDTIIVNGNLSVIPNNTIFNNFNSNKYLKSHMIFYNLDINEVKIIKHNDSLLYKFKRIIKNRINKSNNKEFLYAFILGEKSYIEDDIKNSFKINGISHLLAISGMHISLFTSIIFTILGLLRVLEIRKYYITFVILLLFAFLTNFSSSILRAIIFFTLYGINKLKRLNISNINILLITLDIILIVLPFRILDISLVLSFTITFFILFYINDENNYLKNLFIISIISFLASLPLIINMNYEINILSIINNMLFVPIFSIIVFPITILSFIFPFLEGISIYLINLLVSISIFLNKYALIIRFPKIPFILIVIYYILLLIIKYDRRIVCKILFCLLILVFYILPYIDNGFKIYYLDVSQGDSSIIVMPHNKSVIVIDTGGLKEANENQKSYIFNKINNLYKSIGIKKIDYLILSHGDYDHMGETINLVNNFKVEKIIFNCGEFNDLEKELIKVLDKKKIKYYSCIKELNIDNNKLYFLQTKEYDNENDNSNVIYTELNGYKFMFMGDAGVEKEGDILEKYNLSNIDVLKVGHHGSKTSSGKEFINEINPKYSIISVGKNNRYGHPNKEVLNNLEDSKIYRTDEDGSIMFEIKNNKLDIKTCSP